LGGDFAAQRNTILPPLYRRKVFSKGCRGVIPLGEKGVKGGQDATESDASVEQKHQHEKH